MTTTDNSWVLLTGGFGEEFARQYAEQGHSLVKALVILTRATPRWLHQAFLSRTMNG